MLTIETDELLVNQSKVLFWIWSGFEWTTILVVVALFDTEVLIYSPDFASGTLQHFVHQGIWSKMVL